MYGPALRVWEEAHCSTARFEDVNGQLVLDHIDGHTSIVKLNPAWLIAQGYGRHVEDDGATLRFGEHVFTRVRHLAEPFAAYQHTTET
jgi:hypothetical protein